MSGNSPRPPDDAQSERADPSLQAAVPRLDQRRGPFFLASREVGGRRSGTDGVPSRSRGSDGARRVAGAKSQGSFRAGARWVVHGSGPLAGGPFAEDVAGMVLIRVRFGSSGHG